MKTCVATKVGKISGCMHEKGSYVKSTTMFDVQLGLAMWRNHRVNMWGRKVQVATWDYMSTADHD